MHTLLSRIVFWLCLINGLCSVFFGGLMMMFPVDTPLGLSEMLPMMGNFPFQELFFRDLFWPGLALFLCNGVMNMVTAVAWIRRSDKLPIFSTIAAIMLIAWCVLENVYLFNIAAVFYFAVGVVHLILSILLLKEYRRLGSV